MTDRLEIRDLPGGFRAAEIVGLDPQHHVADPAACEVVRSALAERGVVGIRLEDKLDKDEFGAVTRMFGPIKKPVALTDDGSLYQYDAERQIIDAGFVMTDQVREQLGDRSFGALDDERPGLFETFHIDDAYVAEPASATVLHARVLPPSGGGNTIFLNLRDAYDRLSDELKRCLEGLRAVHAYNNRGAFPPRVSARGPSDGLLPASFPIVRIHPINRQRAFYFDLDRATHVEGMSEAEGRSLLQSLQDHAEAEASRYEHVWRPNDILVWDNATVQHKARGDFPVGEPRRFWRHMVEGGVPF